jgi:exopolysaccharide biosynthesis polyprenyl glycosylphosphotransferase
MLLSQKAKVFLLVFGDLALFYVSLFLALTLRYQEIMNRSIWHQHQAPFFYIHLIWLLVFYIGGMYDVKIFSSYKKMLECILKTVAVSSVVAVFIFYTVPIFDITPKTNLFIDIAILVLLLILWRRLFWFLTKKVSKIKTLLVGKSLEIKNFFELLKNNPQLGYEANVILSEVKPTLLDLIKKHNIQVIIASKNILHEKKAAKRFYEALPLGVSIADFPTFYESLVEKVPLSVINEEWFLENLMEINKKTFEKIKRVLDIVGVILLGIPALALLPLIALLSKIESSDNILVRQKRVGKNGKIFTLIKFRSMYHAAEADGRARWAAEKDPRVTKVGGFLRKTRLDELPQLWNVLKGEMSFIGPRPERPEFVEKLEEKIPHYAMRHLVKPGLSGWAQIKFPYGASIEDAMKKLQYDLYYIKNRSIILDLAIAAKTLATMISRAGR